MTNVKSCREEHETLGPSRYRTVAKTKECVVTDTNRGITCSPQREYEEQVKLRAHRINELEAEIPELQMLRNHKHEWDQSDNCSFCGMDGRS